MAKIMINYENSFSLKNRRKNKRVCFVPLSTFHRLTLASLAFCKNFAAKAANLLRLGRKNKRVCFVLLSTFRRSTLASLAFCKNFATKSRSSWHSEMKRKASFPFAFPSFFRRSTLASHAFCKNFAAKAANLLRLGRKNKRVCFVLLSTFRNFAVSTAKLLRLGKKRSSSFVLLSTFRNFADRTHLCRICRGGQKTRNKDEENID